MLRFDICGQGRRNAAFVNPEQPFRKGRGEHCGSCKITIDCLHSKPDGRGQSGLSGNLRQGVPIGIVRGKDIARLGSPQAVSRPKSLGQGKPPNRPARGQGIGCHLLTRAIEASEQAGFWTLQAGIFPENAASLALHKRCGFRLVGYRERLGQMNGTWRDVALMERRSEIVGI